MKKVILIIFFMLTILPLRAEIITGGVEYNTNSARIDLLQTEKQTIPKVLLNANLIDQNHAQNLSMMLKGVTELKDRTLAYFSDGSYGIIYKNNPKYVWYYNNDGSLTHSEVKTSSEYPYKTFKYNTNGELVNMTLRVSKDETFIFKPNGKLIAHWLGQYCYDEDNNIIMSRKVLE